MIIETYDLISRLCYIRAFAPSSRIDRDNALVRIAWTGTQLHISAYATSYGAVATWESVPVDDAPGEILLPNAKVKEIIDTFELKGANTQHTPLDVEIGFNTLRIRRAGNADEGVPAKSYGYTSEIEHNPPKTCEVFADLGAPQFGEPVRMDPSALIALAAVAKRSEMQVQFDPYERGVRSTIGPVTAFSRHPIEPEVAEKAADEDAIAKEALAGVGGAA
ncbi:hypothetical protein I0C86_41610 [Plantactinospora sp. S1510]|uniref:Gfo/Idh/MocA-like oxidoreductase C-terminal domain-containing protein n=1 Tax=Plantactinospora alkalitolerans TaxID=2789879 RepID=A0ABS0HA44_9ACTN|nr:hypothetical protein [Plantactinospora alkalitolerans]MBF9135351.1 hypothetical protein [Plantactinospora alkalitolerans]